MLLLSMSACGDDGGSAGTTSADPSTSADSTSTGQPATTAVDTSGSSSGSSGPGTTGTTGTTMEVSSSSSGEGESTTAGVVSASAMLEPKSGSNASGTALFTLADDGSVDLMVELAEILPPGTHALHIHEFPDCTAEDATSAGMHWNPAGTMLGELGTVEIADDGTGVFTKSDAWSIGTGMDNDVVGHSIVVHADSDGGTRIACGVIAQD